MLGPTDKERHVCGALEETLLLPRMMVAKMIAMVGEKADQCICGITACLDSIQNPPDAVVDICNCAVVPCPQHAGMRIVNILRPHRIVHPWNLLVHVIHFQFATYRIGHSVRIVQAIKRNGRSQWRMRSDEGDESEVRL